MSLSRKLRILPTYTWALSPLCLHIEARWEDNDGRNYRLEVQVEKDWDPVDSVERLIESIHYTQKIARRRK